jgi:hypothetical protein
LSRLLLDPQLVEGPAPVGSVEEIRRLFVFIMLEWSDRYVLVADDRTRGLGRAVVVAAG